MIAEPSILFEQITDEMIEKQLNKLHQNDNKLLFKIICQTSNQQ